jgi:hypothetical protein
MGNALNVLPLWPFSGVVNQTERLLVNGKDGFCTIAMERVYSNAVFRHDTSACESELSKAALGRAFLPL